MILHALSQNFTEEEGATVGGPAPKFECSQSSNSGLLRKVLLAGRGAVGPLGSRSLDETSIRSEAIWLGAIQVHTHQSSL